MGTNGTGGKEVYEYTPDPGSHIIHDNSSQEAFDRGEATAFSSIILAGLLAGHCVHYWEPLLYLYIRCCAHISAVVISPRYGGTLAKKAASLRMVEA